MELVKSFIQQARLKNLSSRVHATDCDSALSSACWSADVSASLPRISCPEYPAALKEYCLSNNIGLVVPTIDTELSLLADVRRDFEKSGIVVAISDPAFIAGCQDKRLTGEIFAGAGIRYPALYDSESMRFPCFAKPYDGSASIGAQVVSSRDDLGDELLDDPKIVFMELISDKFCEYTVDAYFSRNGQLRCLVPRKRLEVRSGEVSKGITRRNFVFDTMRRGFNQLPGSRGCLTIQVFVNETTEEIIGLEINPRFGGGYPLSYAAGANFPGWLIDEYLLHKSVSSFDAWEVDLLMLRYDAKVLVQNAGA